MGTEAQPSLLTAVGTSLPLQNAAGTQRLGGDGNRGGSEQVWLGKGLYAEERVCTALSFCSEMPQNQITGSS